jgi:hypothetical protein
MTDLLVTVASLSREEDRLSTCFGLTLILKVLPVDKGIATVIVDTSGYTWKIQRTETWPRMPTLSVQQRTALLPGRPCLLKKSPNDCDHMV